MKCADLTVELVFESVLLYVYNFFTVYSLRKNGIKLNGCSDNGDGEAKVTTTNIIIVIIVIIIFIYLDMCIQEAVHFIIRFRWLVFFFCLMHKNHATVQLQLEILELNKFFPTTTCNGIYWYISYLDSSTVKVCK